MKPIDIGKFPRFWSLVGQKSSGHNVLPIWKHALFAAFLVDSSMFAGGVAWPVPCPLSSSVCSHARTRATVRLQP